MIYSIQIIEKEDTMNKGLLSSTISTENSTYISYFSLEYRSPPMSENIGGVGSRVEGWIN